MVYIDVGKIIIIECILFYMGKNYKIGEVYEGIVIMDWMEQVWIVFCFIYGDGMNQGCCSWFYNYFQYVLLLSSVLCLIWCVCMGFLQE